MTFALVPLLLPSAQSAAFYCFSEPNDTRAQAGLLFNGSTCWDSLGWSGDPVDWHKWFTNTDPNDLSPGGVGRVDVCVPVNSATYSTNFPGMSVTLTLYRAEATEWWLGPDFAGLTAVGSTTVGYGGCTTLIGFTSLDAHQAWYLHATSTSVGVAYEITPS